MAFDLVRRLYQGKKVLDERAKARRRRQIVDGALRVQNGLVRDEQLRSGGKNHDGLFVVEREKR